ncbi:hypothetical protein BY458DRAFT_550225 [Sporodiniella umbellata]|nr:hypothetical protein BY458DRAFT_550225 [Sporodiniella umbellata]
MGERTKNRFHKFFFQLASQLGVNRRTSLRVGLTLLILIALRFLFSLFHIKKTLNNHPKYSRQARNCSAVLCNPFGKCSTWYSDREYDWPELAQAGIFRDLATAQVGVGCELAIKIQGSNWKSLPSGKTNCLKHDIRCRDLVELKLKANILILASHLRERMKEPSNEGREIILVHGGQATNSVDVTLVDQILADQLDRFSQTMEDWRGPVSLIVYLRHSEDIDILIDFFKKPGALQLYSKATITLLKPNYSHVDHLTFPINYLRNLAITESLTDYVFVTHTIPSLQLQNLIQTQLIPSIDSSPERKTAWIVPSFRVSQDYEPLPETYRGWKTWVDLGLASINGDGLSLVQPSLTKSSFAYEVCYESHWELDYIVHRLAPLYDIRFNSQGEDRRSHALHLNAEGYRFKVIRQAFSFIRVLSNDKDFRKKSKPSSHYNGFIQDIVSVYGRNPTWPRGCSAMAIGWHAQNRNTLGLAVGSV